MGGVTSVWEGQTDLCVHLIFSTGCEIFLHSRPFKQKEYQISFGVGACKRISVKEARSFFAVARSAGANV